MLALLTVPLLAASLAAPAPGGGDALALAPGRVVTVTPCLPDPTAPCWDEATPLARFAAEDAARRPPAEADVRLAWQDGRLLVRAATLPPGAHLEVSLTRGTEDALDAPTSVLLEAGIRAIDPIPVLTAGIPRRLRIHLRVPDDGGTTLLTWAPDGRADLARPAWLLPVDVRPSARLSVSRRDDRLVLEAPGAERIEIVQDRALRPRMRVGVPPAWSAAGSPPLLVDPPPVTGWFTVTATWRRGDRITALAEGRLYHTATIDPPIPAAGIVPAPRTFNPRRGRPFRPGPGTGVVVGSPAVAEAAALLAEEVRRFTGQPVPVRTAFLPGDAWIGLPADPIPLPGSPEGELPAEGFRIVCGAAGAAVTGADLRGALYGALALADAVGPDGEAPPFAAADAPALPWRVFYHSLQPGSSSMYPVDRYRQFLRRGVLRGRFNVLVLGLEAGWTLRSHPEIGVPGGWTRPQLQAVLDAAHALGLVVVPGTNVPAHAAWLVQAHPELAEDATRDQACTRHPDYRRILADVYDELWDLFGRPPFFHVGHDEALWDTERTFFEDQRCPRCSATPRWRLYAEDLLWHRDFFAAKGVRILAWADILAQGGSLERPRPSPGVDLIPEAARKDILLLSWSHVYDPPTLLRGLGFPLLRVHTGYDDWQRAGLGEILPDLTGEGIAVFTPAPWLATTLSGGSEGLRYHWPAALLAGLTAWRPDLAVRGPIDETLASLADQPAFLPGYAAIPGSGPPVPLALDGPPAGPADPAAHLPPSASVVGATFRIGPIRSARQGAPVRVAVDRRVAGIALLQAAAADHGAELALERPKGYRKFEAPAAARVRARYADGEVREAMLRYGLDTFAPDGAPRSAFLWGTAGTLRVPSPAAAGSDPTAADRTLYRWDWVNPRPDVRVQDLEVEPLVPGLALLVAAASAWPG